MFCNGMHTLKDDEFDTNVALMCEDSGEHLWRECCEPNPFNSEGAVHFRRARGSTKQPGYVLLAGTNHVIRGFTPKTQL